jgi:hypothetical protein
MIRTNWLKAALLPVGLMALFSTTAAAAVVDCTTLTISCFTFQKGGVKFKPVLSAANVLGDCKVNGVDVIEAISIKGKLLGCVVSNPNVKVVSGSAKGTLYTDDCSCAGLAAASVPIATPPPGKTNTLVASWKFDSTSTDTCMPGQTSSTIGQVPGMAVIHQGFFHAPSPPFSAALGATYGGFSLSGAGTGISGIFQGGDTGASSLLAGLSNEDVFFLGATCQSVKGLKALTFGQAEAELK